MFRRKSKNPEPKTKNTWWSSLNAAPSTSGPSNVAPSRSDYPRNIECNLASTIPPSPVKSTCLSPPLTEFGQMRLYDEDNYDSTRMQSSLNDHGLRPHNPTLPPQDINNPRTVPLTHPNQTTTYRGHHTEIFGDHNYNIISNFGGSQIVNKADALQLLWQAITDVGATHNSEVRYPPPRCHAETRKIIRQQLRKQIDSHAGPQVCWLSGSAGVGKSAIAQTISEECEQDRKLVASFFFSRNDAKRNIPTYLFLVIAYGLASSIPELRASIGLAIQSNPAILHHSLEHQFTELIAKPCRSLGRQGPKWEGCPRLVVIDGLDECVGGESQTRVLSIIADAFRDPAGLPLQFLICSRPEPTIKEFFDSEIFRPYLYCYFLHDDYSSWDDIGTFLHDGFYTIRSKPKYQHLHFPNPWPASDVLWSLVQRSCGQFIYPSTILKYVDDEYSDPCQRLDVILGIASSLGITSPFHDLDCLYQHILSANPNQTQILNILGIILSWPHLKPQDILNWPSPSLTLVEMLLGLRPGEAALALRGMHRFSIFQDLKMK
ncbi:hypothetical protein L218DRAFT_933992 [Marasmius fiardii PR-910]|nr:hypothetical protein L218DRAFT_933992 [Marasmius fiardii PR-910]